jgi:hypothetical protein
MTPNPQTPDTNMISRRHSTSSDVYMASPISQTSPSQISSRILHSQLYTPPAHPSSQYHPSSLMTSDAHDLRPGYHHPSLAPAPPITSSRGLNRRSLSSRIPPSLTPLGQTSRSGRSTYHPPLTPTNGSAMELGQQGVVRNQAEQDAVETLLFMSSPVNSGNMKYVGSAGSPLGPKRVQFENSPHQRGS